MKLNTQTAWAFCVSFFISIFSVFGFALSEGFALEEGHMPMMICDDCGGGEGSLGPPVIVSGRQLLVDFDRNGIYDPYVIKGIGFNPYPIGVFQTEWGTCQYCQTSSDCYYHNGGVANDHFACSAEQPTVSNPTQNGGPIHPWGGQNCGSYEPYPNKCVNLFDRGDVDLDRDFQNLVLMHVNTIRTWEKVTPKLLSKANQYGLKVIAGYGVGTLVFQQSGQNFILLTNTQAIIDDFKNYVSRMMQDPNFSSVLFIAIGNENNYSYYTPGAPAPTDAPGCYVSTSGGSAITGKMHAWYTVVNQLACAAKNVLRDNYRPIAVVNGDIAEINNPAFATTDANMTCLDIWGSNVYRGISFGDLFDSYAQKSQKPFWIAEAGVDALYTNNFYDDLGDGIYNPVNAQEDQGNQALWMGKQWDEIVNHSNTTVGVTFFEYSDEYWKANGWIPNSYGWDALSRQQNNAGQCFTYIPSTGAMPDNFFNEEWFGIMKIQYNGLNPNIMMPRQTYWALQKRFACGGDTPYYMGTENNKSCDISYACCNNSLQVAKNGSCVSSCVGMGGGGNVIRKPLAQLMPE